MNKPILYWGFQPMLPTEVILSKDLEKMEDMCKIIVVDDDGNEFHTYAINSVVEQSNKINEPIYSTDIENDFGYDLSEIFNYAEEHGLRCGWFLVNGRLG